MGFIDDKDSPGHASFVRSRLIPIITFSFLAILLISDFIDDIFGNKYIRQEGVESVVRAMTILGVSFLWYQWWQERKESNRARLALRQEHEESRQWKMEADRWRTEARDALRGLSEIIDHQFARWDLSPAEKEVAMLLLKGLSHKEVASVRGISERTIRQQALKIYQKSGLSGRAELSAFFLEDLLLPKDERDAPPSARTKD